MCIKINKSNTDGIIAGGDVNTYNEYTISIPDNLFRNKCFIIYEIFG